jgi:hypothetical protein
MTKRNLDGVYFRVMRDGEWQDICWTDLVWEDRIEFMRKHNDEGWLIRMIEIMNGIAREIKIQMPMARICEVRLPQGKVTKTWLRNSLVKLTAETRIAAEEMSIVRSEV